MLRSLSHRCRLRAARRYLSTGASPLLVSPPATEEVLRLTLACGVQGKLKDKNLLRTDCYINGEWVRAKNGRTSKVLNPANGQVSVPRPTRT